MRIGRLIIQNDRDVKLRLTKQERADALRKGGFRKMAARAQAKADREAGKK